VRSLAQSLAETYRANRALHGELASFRVSALQVQSIAEPPSIPVVVVSRGRNEWQQEARGGGMEEVWTQLQKDLSGYYPHSRHVIATNSGHYVHLEQPQTVVASVLELVRQHREKAR